MHDPFVYTAAVENVGVVETHVAAVPAGVGGKAELLGHLASQLLAPEYFGRNWDALDECLRDLSWIEEPRVVLFHEALPELDEAGLRTYLGILRDAVFDWRSDELNELIVAFPPAACGPIGRLLGAEDG